QPSADFPAQLGWFKQFKKILPLTAGLRRVRIAVMGNGTLNFLADLLRLWLGLEGYVAEIYLCAYNSWRQEILDSQSAFYAFRAEIVWLLASERDVDFGQIAPGADTAACEAAVEFIAQEWRSCWEQIQRHRPVRIIQCNVEEPPLRVFGHYEAAVPWSRSSLIHALNRSVSEFARQDQVGLFDLAYIAACFGLTRWREDRHWQQSKQPFHPDAFGMVAFQFARLVGSMLGSMRKCIVVDLDNTLWGGVIGDDGVEGIQLGDGAAGGAFAAFQDYLKDLLKRGILLAVCSKNDQAIAEEPFQKHPAMRLKLEDISCFCANWENKADNLRKIAKTLNIGLDSLVFVDDNPSERELVRSQLPEVSVVAMPEDPSEYAAALAAGCFFETASFSTEDAARVQFYRENSLRESSRQAATDLSGFLRDLEMVADSGSLDSFHLPRMAQLLAKTNQFHLTTTRYSEAELTALEQNAKTWMRWYSLRDRFGDHGLISVAILCPEEDAMAIDTWAMSCRVFNRGMEEFIFLDMLDAARAMGASRLIGRYRPTAKNHPVAGLYKRLGFAFDGSEDSTNRWVLDLSAPMAQAPPYITPTAKREEAPLAEAR
ncbi:MAG: HAD-IIIC family phosphatase, partial [Terracidiphilus sp.]